MTTLSIALTFVFLIDVVISEIEVDSISYEYWKPIIRQTSQYHDHENFKNLGDLTFHGEGYKYHGNKMQSRLGIPFYNTNMGKSISSYSDYPNERIGYNYVPDKSYGYAPDRNDHLIKGTQHIFDGQTEIVLGLLEATENKFLYPVSKTLYELESVPPLHILGFALGVVLLSFIIIGGNLAEIYLFSPFCTDFCLNTGRIDCSDYVSCPVYPEPCLDRDSTCDPKADRCCPGLICLAESGSTDFICGTAQESFRKRDEGKHEHEPDWCQGARPDCSLPYTKKHCNRTCQDPCSTIQCNTRGSDHCDISSGECYCGKYPSCSASTPFCANPNTMNATCISEVIVTIQSEDNISCSCSEEANDPCISADEKCHAVQGTMKTSPQSLDDYQIVNNSTSYEDTNDEKEMEETMINDEFSTTTNLNPPR